MVPLSKDQLNQLIDGIFDWIKKAVGANLVARLALDAGDAVVKVGADALYDHLVKQGVVAPTDGVTAKPQ